MMLKVLILCFLLVSSFSFTLDRRSWFRSMACTLPTVNIASAGIAAAAAPSEAAKGSKAPLFELPNSRGDGMTSLSALIRTGKWTVLYFYPGAFSKGCTLEARSFQRDIESYKVLNTQIVGISVDPVEKNAQFCASEGLDFYMLSDTGGRVSNLYGSSLAVPGFGTFSNRQTYIIDPKGIVRWVFTDVESKIPGHSQEVIGKLTELETVESSS